MPSSTVEGSAAMPVRPASRIRLSTYLVLAAVVLGCALRIYYFEPSIARSPDERTYTRQASIVLAQGTDAFRFLGQELAHDPPAVSRYPSPLRAGYISLLVALMKLTGDTSIVTGAQLSFLCSMTSLILIGFISQRFLSPTVAIVATLFYAVFPFDLTTFRRTWQESFIAMLTISFLTLAAVIAGKRGVAQHAAFAGFAVVGTFCMTSKENAGLAFLLCAAGLTLHFVLQRDRHSAILTAASATAAVLAYVLILSVLFGGPLNAFKLVREYAHYSGINPYSVQFDSGPLWMIPAGLFRTSPFLVVGSITGFAAILIRGIRARALSSAGLPLGIALLTFSMFLIQVAAHRYSFRYTAPVFAPICLLAGIGADAVLPALLGLLAPLGRKAAWAILGAAISIAALRDFNMARDLFLQPYFQDLALRPILGVPPAPVPPGYPR